MKSRLFIGSPPQIGMNYIDRSVFAPTMRSSWRRTQAAELLFDFYRSHAALYTELAREPLNIVGDMRTTVQCM
jgi:hypothetical protein